MVVADEQRLPGEPYLTAADDPDPRRREGVATCGLVRTDLHRERPVPRFVGAHTSPQSVGSEFFVRLTIVMWSYETRSIGGYRVHYEYANRLAARGHTVTVFAHVPSRRARLGLRRRGLRRYSSWFEFDPRVRLTISGKPQMPQSDVAIVTSWGTAAMIPSSSRRAGATVQVVFDYEFWMSGDDTTRERMTQAFARPDVVVATSRAVGRMLREAGREPAATIPCGLDLDTFSVRRDPASRDAVVGFIARPESVKRCEDAIAALALVRETHDVRVLAVGRGRMDLPSWVEIIDAPTDNEMRSFYNELSVFLLPSEYEGWGLPAAEAMACGAAVVSTRCGGVEDFASDGVNALLVPPRHPVALAKACSQLLDDRTTRNRIVTGGMRTARALDWEPSVDALEQILARFG
jgi:glycosyltransferase involved in cell wall biosynthesis